MSDEHERQRRKQAAKAMIDREVKFNPPADLERRRACLADPFLFLQTYFSAIFWQPFTPDRRAMVEAIIHASSFSGDYALAGPRGEGKTKMALFVSLWLILNGKLRLPLICGKNQDGAENELDNLKIELITNELLAADFPEVCAPLIALDGWASRARKQTVNGYKTNIGWSKDCLIFPNVPAEALPSDWPAGEPSLSHGQGMAVVGIDGKIRGFNRRNIRPDLAIVDDIDDRGSARSQTQTLDHQNAIDQDIAGLAGSGQRVARVMLCTVINSTCIAALYTLKASWRGQRFKMLVALPDREDLWTEYIELRRNRAKDDPDARAAHRHYLAHRDEMDRGAVVSNPYAHDSKPGSDGEPLEVSTLQACYNRIADIGWDAFCCEYQNDPVEVEGIETAGITNTVVESRLSGLSYKIVHPATIAITAGIDMGKTYCNWVVTAWQHGAIGNVIDYGVLKVVGTSPSSSDKAIEQALYDTLIEWRSYLLAAEYADEAGNEFKLSAVLIDAGYFPDSVYRFVLDVGTPFFATMGIKDFRHGTASPNRIVGEHWFATPQRPPGVWLYNLDQAHWKGWAHERFLTPTFDGNQQRNSGSLALFAATHPQEKRERKEFAHQVCAQVLCTEYVEGKGWKRYWKSLGKQDHYLDALKLACAGSSFAGVKLIGPSTVVRSQQPDAHPARQQEPSRPFMTPSGKPFLMTERR